jgi:hypothetical protein
MARVFNTHENERGNRPQRNGRSNSDGRSESDSSGSEGRSRSSRLTGTQAAALAQQHLEELINRPCDSVSGLSRQQDGWTVMLEVVELQRVPPTTDILASYRVELDEDGELMGYKRVSRYYRNQASGDS